MELSDFLNQVLYDDSLINLFNEDTFEIEINSPVDNKMLMKVLNTYMGHDKECLLWTNLLSYLYQNVIDSKLIDYFIENHIGIDILAHFNLDDKQLEKLCPLVDEAVFSLGKRKFIDNQYSNLDFLNFINKYYSDALIKQLLFICKYNTVYKLGPLSYFVLKTNKASSEIKKIMEQVIFAEVLEKTSDSIMLKSAYKKENYIINIALAKNLFTPEEILCELSLIKNGPYCSLIRKLSNETLKDKKVIEKLNY